MKKILLVLIVAMALFTFTTYFFIPSPLTISAVTIIRTTDNGTQRFLTDSSKWPLWWNYSNKDSAAPIKSSGPVFGSNGDSFQLTQKFYKSINIQIQHNQQKIDSKLVIIPLDLDSTGIEWKYTLPAAINPFTRISQYRDAKEIKGNMETVLNNLKRFLSKTENVYGIPIERNFLKDTLYVTAKKMVSSYPGTVEIYQLIKTIQGYAGKNGTKQTGNPIFNVTDFGNHHFQLMAGIPIEVKIPEKEGFALKHMVRGSFMITEVVGGNYTVDQASKNLQLYFSDFNRTSMAMNFTMLVTDRVLQPDTTRWITKIYLPVY